MNALADLLIGPYCFTLVSQRKGVETLLKYQPQSIFEDCHNDSQDTTR